MTMTDLDVVELDNVVDRDRARLCECQWREHHPDGDGCDEKARYRVVLKHTTRRCRDLALLVCQGCLDERLDRAAKLSKAGSRCRRCKRPAGKVSDLIGQVTRL